METVRPISVDEKGNRMTYIGSIKHVFRLSDNYPGFVFDRRCDSDVP
jgi:hypothetical protein